MKKTILILAGPVIALVFILIGAPQASGEIGECGTGYEFQPSSGVGCVQIDCGSYPNAHYSYTSRCLCGSAGSLYENPADPNKSCNYSQEHAACPGCLYACVHNDEDCPAEPGSGTVNANTAVQNSNAAM